MMLNNDAELKKNDAASFMLNQHASISDDFHVK